MPESEGKVVISPSAFTLMVLHAIRYRATPVHGILVGAPKDGDTIFVEEIFPVCHENPTNVLIESSIAMALSNIETSGSTTKVVGWYTVPEMVTTSSPGPVAMRIVASLEINSHRQVLLNWKNDALGKIFDSEDYDQGDLVTAFGKDFGKQWLKKLALSVEREDAAIKAIQSLAKDRTLHDLVDHWNHPLSTEWPVPQELKSKIAKYI